MGAEHNGDMENNIFSLFWAYCDVIMGQIGKYWKLWNTYGTLIAKNIGAKNFVFFNFGEILGNFGENS